MTPRIDISTWVPHRYLELIRTKVKWTLDHLNLSKWQLYPSRCLPQKCGHHSWHFYLLHSWSIYHSYSTSLRVSICCSSKQLQNLSGWRLWGVYESSAWLYWAYSQNVGQVQFYGMYLIIPDQGDGAPPPPPIWGLPSSWQITRTQEAYRYLWVL